MMIYEEASTAAGWLARSKGTRLGGGGGGGGGGGCLDLAVLVSCGIYIRVYSYV